MAQIESFFVTALVDFRDRLSITHWAWDVDFPNYDICGLIEGSEELRILDLGLRSPQANR